MIYYLSLSKRKEENQQISAAFHAIISSKNEKDFFSLERKREKKERERKKERRKERER